MVKFFHVSQHKFSVGETVVNPTGGAVFMTTSVVPHYTMIEIINHAEYERNGWSAQRNHRWDKREWVVYEVAPMGNIYRGDCWDEALARSFKISRVVGNANGILNNAYKNWKNKDGAGYRGSRVKRSEKLN